jgi:hypothetical protein
MDPKPSENGSSQRPAAPGVIGVNNMVFLPGQNQMQQNGSNPNQMQQSEVAAVEPRSIQPRLSLQYFEPEAFLEVTQSFVVKRSFI